MKIRLITVGKPKLDYAKLGWDEYLGRLNHFYSVRLIQLPDKYADDHAKFAEACAASFVVALEITGTALGSQQLATFLAKRRQAGQDVSFVIGGPNGLPALVRQQADFLWSLSDLTLPHDLAMVVAAEALYRASTINAGLPYHK